MPLPSLEKVVPIFDITIPSTGDIVKFRPFLVKEEKLLLIAMEGDEKSMDDALAQIVESCAISPIKVETLASFDLQYIFLQIRAKSVNEFVELAYRCNNDIALEPEEITKRAAANIRFKKQLETLAEGEPVIAPCENVVKIKLDLRTVQVQFHPEHTKTIYLTDTIGVTMKYPTVAVSRMLVNSSKANKEPDARTSIADGLKTIAMCIESVFDAETQWTQFTIKELTEWIEKLTQPQFVKIQEFFETMPKLKHDVDFECPKCGHKEVLHLEGLTSFFG